MNSPEPPDHQHPLARLSFYANAPHPCSYIEHQKAISVFADPAVRMTTELYGKLASMGFRRSGEHVYAPDCPACHACIPVRIPVRDFRPNRSQRRTLTQNRSVEITRSPALFDQAHYDLYCRYIASRHTGSSMDNPTPETYMSFLTSYWSDTSFYVFRRDGELLAISVIDQLPNALSAVYTFFDPDLSRLSPGNFTILSLISEAEQLGHHWLYLGYWIAESRKMAYKNQYRPFETLQQGHWQTHPAGTQTPALST